MECEICKEPITDEIKAIKIKKKVLYSEAYDNIWWNFKKCYICEHCLNKIHQLVDFNKKI